LINFDKNEVDEINYRNRRGEITKKETLAIDRDHPTFRKENPKLLFIPTASSDSEEYWRYSKLLWRFLGVQN
jgi:hypothetical protein